MYAADLMTRQVRTVPSDSDLAAAVRIMDEGGFHQVPVMEADRPIGLLTDHGVRRALLEGRTAASVGELASALPCLLGPEAPLSEVLLALQAADSLLIVAENGRLAGIITYWDVLRVARPSLLVAEVELLLRKVVAEAYSEQYGPDWWPHVRPDLRSRAEEEHRRDAREGNSAEHMLGHTSFWSLIEIFKEIRPDVPDDRIQSFHKVREWRNQVAHLYLMSEAEVTALVRDCLAMRDFLEAPPSPTCSP